MRDCVVRRHLNHLFKLGGGPLVIAIFLGDDPEIEPGVRNPGILLLRLFEFGDGSLGFAGAQ